MTKISLYAILFSQKTGGRFLHYDIIRGALFEIRATGAKSEVNNFINYLKSGEIDEFFEFSSDYINYDDDYATADANTEVTVIISNDDYGIEIDEFYTDEFLEVICKAGKRLYLKGQLFDADNEDYSFVSEIGNSYYTNALLVKNFNEDEDKPVEEDDEEEEE